MGDFKWTFVVVQRNGAMEKLLSELNAEFGLGENAFYQAPTLIIVFTDKASCALGYANTSLPLPKARSNDIIIRA